MTPATHAAKKAGIAYQLHSYAHDAGTTAWGEEAAQALGLNPARVFKTLLVSLNGDPKQLAVAIVPVCATLDLKSLSTILKAKKAAMADPAQAQRATGYVVGGISPLGQKKRLPTVVDSSAALAPTLHVSAGRRGLEIELSSTDLCAVTGAVMGDIAREKTS